MGRTYRELLKEGISLLKSGGIADAPIDAELLLLHIIGKPRSFLFLHGNDLCRAEDADRYADLIDRRRRGEPAQYITGCQEFMGLEFRVDPSVLIPRQDTETLVEKALEAAENMPGALRILDMCCGSGAIAVSMASFLPDVRVTACDISRAALRTAGENAKRNGVSEKVEFLHSDMFSVFEKNAGPAGKPSFDLILSNPPYIRSDVIPTLQREITEHEPASALDGGKDGLFFYRILAEKSWKYLKKEGMLFMEIGHDQAEDVLSLFSSSGHYTDAGVIRDLAGLDRVVRCRPAASEDD